MADSYWTTPEKHAVLHSNLKARHACIINYFVKSIVPITICGKPWRLVWSEDGPDLFGECSCALQATNPLAQTSVSRLRVHSLDTLNDL